MDQKDPTPRYYNIYMGIYMDHYMHRALLFNIYHLVDLYKVCSMSPDSKNDPALWSHGLQRFIWAKHQEDSCLKLLDIESLFNVCDIT